MEMNQNNKQTANNDLAWTLVSLLQRNKLPIDRERLRQQLSSLHDIIGLPVAARSLGLDVMFKCIAPHELRRLRLPTVAFFHTPNESSNPVEQPKALRVIGANGIAAMVGAVNAVQHNKRCCIVIRADEHR